MLAEAPRQVNEPLKLTGVTPLSAEMDGDTVARLHRIPVIGDARLGTIRQIRGSGRSRRHQHLVDPVSVHIDDLELQSTPLKAIAG